MEQSDRFDEFTGQRVGHKKSLAFSAPFAENYEFLSRGEKLKSVNAEKALGILMEVHCKIETSIHGKRFDKTKDVITMIDILPIPV